MLGRSLRLAPILSVGVLMVLVAGGCGGGSRQPGAIQSGSDASAPPHGLVVATPALASATAMDPAATDPANAAGTPDVGSLDLTTELDAVDQQLNGINADLGADASATTNEGSPQ